MKKFIVLSFICLITFSAQAKKVKFAVDMSTFTISPVGMHLISDFQVLTGFGTLDWDPGSMPLTKEGNTSIYSIVVNLPAFQKYEFKFVNGNQTYEAEFVPNETRVGYSFNDNRWLYVDSLANDTLKPGAVIFGTNAPVGKSSIRYVVDMSSVSASTTTGVHVGTSYQTPTTFNPTKIRLYSFGSNVFEMINYINNGTYSFTYYNGNTLGNGETVPNACASNGKRTAVISKDTILPTVCFSACSSTCTAAGVNELTKANFQLKVYPNPANGFITISTDLNDNYHVTLFDNSGKVINQFVNNTSNELSISTTDLPTGIYQVRVSPKNGISTTRSISILH
jgi:hypothetical protein